jgi:hypothetical protein
MNNTMNNRNNNSSSEAMPRTIVGAVWVENPGAWWVPRGLERTQGPGAKPLNYRPVFFGAQQEWASDEHGWQIYETRRTRQARRRKSRQSSGSGSDSYDFDDSY